MAARLSTESRLLATWPEKVVGTLQLRRRRRGRRVPVLVPGGTGGGSGENVPVLVLKVEGGERGEG